MISLDMTTGYLFENNIKVSRLNKSERLIVKLFFTSPGVLITKGELLDSGWPNSCVSQNSLTVAIKNIRSSLSSMKFDLTIETIHKQGYIFHPNNTQCTLIESTPTEDNCTPIKMTDEKDDKKSEKADSYNSLTVNTIKGKFIKYAKIKFTLFLALYIASMITFIFIHTSKVSLTCKEIGNAKICGAFELTSEEESFIRNKINSRKGTFYYGHHENLSTIEVYHVD